MTLARHSQISGISSPTRQHAPSSHLYYHSPSLMAMQPTYMHRANRTCLTLVHSEHSPVSEVVAMAELSILSQTAKRKFELDTDILDCPICQEPLASPVFQCRNGHIACSACREKIPVAKGCPSCSRPVGVIRNVAIEKIIASLMIDCKYASHGCTVKLPYSEQSSAEQHENECEYQPILCPFQSGPSKCTHMSSKTSVLEHLVQIHGVPVVECAQDFSAGSTSFSLKATSPITVLRSGEGWLMVNCGVTSTNSGSDIFCRVFEGSKLKVAHKLSLKRIRLKGEEKLFFMYTCMQVQTQTFRNLDVNSNSVVDTVGSYRALYIPHEEIDRSDLEFDLKLRLL